MDQKRTGGTKVEDYDVPCLNATMAEAKIVTTSLPKYAPSIDWQFYPRSKKATPLAEAVVQAFKTEAKVVSSASYEHNSNKVLSVLHKHLVEIGFQVESGKKE